MDKNDPGVAYPIGETMMDDVADDRCPILYALDIVGQKWKLPILWYLHEAKATRYLELKRRMPGITNTMLTKSLRELEEAGLVSRHNYGTVPPKVDYSLTEDGEARRHRVGCRAEDCLVKCFRVSEGSGVKSAVPLTPAECMGLDSRYFWPNASRA